MIEAINHGNPADNIKECDFGSDEEQADICGRCQDKEYCEVYIDFLERIITNGN